MARRSSSRAPSGSSAKEGEARRRATTIASAGRLVLTGGPGNSRLFVYLGGNYIHRVERERRELYFGDLDLARVAEVIGAAGVEPGMRDFAFRDRHKSFDSVVGIEEQPSS